MKAVRFSIYNDKKNTFYKEIRKKRIKIERFTFIAHKNGSFHFESVQMMFVLSFSNDFYTFQSKNDKDS